MTRKLRVGVIFGGRSGEHDVSLRSALSIMQALDRSRFELLPIGITREGRWITSGNPLGQLASTSRLPLPAQVDTMRNDSSPAAQEDTRLAFDMSSERWTDGIDVLFPVLHGPFGEDGTIQGLIEMSGLPYVGAGVLASALAMDKVVSKQLFAQAGLPIANWNWFLRRHWRQDPSGVAERIAVEIGFPCFVKPANLGSSVGISKVHTPDELSAAIEEAARYDRKIVVEEAINARELEVSVLGNDEPISSIVGEIVPSNEFYDYEAKYVDDRSELLVPAPIDQATSDQARAMAVEAFKLVDGAGMARVDFFLERGTGKLYLNELNTIPGFTSISMYPRLWQATGVPYSELVTRLIELALERHAERQEQT